MESHPLSKIEAFVSIQHYSPALATTIWLLSGVQVSYYRTHQGFVWVMLTITWDFLYHLPISVWIQISISSSLTHDRWCAGCNTRLHCFDQHVYHVYNCESWLWRTTGFSKHCYKQRDPDQNFCINNSFRHCHKLIEDATDPLAHTTQTPDSLSNLYHSHGLQGYC